MPAAGASLSVLNNMAQTPEDVAFEALDLKLVVPEDLVGSPLDALFIEMEACGTQALWVIGSLQCCYIVSRHRESALSHTHLLAYFIKHTLPSKQHGDDNACVSTKGADTNHHRTIVFLGQMYGYPLKRVFGTTICFKIYKVC